LKKNKKEKIGNWQKIGKSDKNMQAGKAQE